MFEFRPTFGDKICMCICTLRPQVAENLHFMTSHDPVCHFILNQFLLSWEVYRLEIT